MTRTFRLFLIFVLSNLASCVPSKHITTIESCTYDDKTNQTTYNVLPFGAAVMPGKWTKTTFNKVSYQQHFKNADTISVSVAINQASNYPFYKPNMSSNEVVKAMYYWDAEYWAKQIGASTPLLKQDTLNHFLIWQILSDKNGYDVNNYYLFGCENGIVFTVFIATEKWNLTQKISFLQTVYSNKKVGNCCK
ncbi:MAG: hypothetical protein IT236_02680 [Bacteroidia bacterium]|nr:hypothetical protein [Bacteroidia bacterium]